MPRRAQYNSENQVQHGQRTVWRDWSRIVFNELLGTRKGDFVAQFWKAFIDDSADEKRAEFIVAGCIFGPKELWNVFNKAWRKALHESPRIEYFHGKELRSLNGEFFRFRDPVKYPKPAGSSAANAKRDRLRAVVESSGLLLCGVGVLVPEYQRVRASHPRGIQYLAEDPFEYVLQQLVFEVTSAIVKRDSTVKIGFTSDCSSRSEVYSRVYVDAKKRNPETAKAMLGLAHLDDRATYGLQAADMAASSVKTSYDNLGRDEEEKRSLPLELAFWRIQIQREANLIRMLDSQPDGTIAP